MPDRCPDDTARALFSVVKAIQTLPSLDPANVLLSLVKVQSDEKQLKPLGRKVAVVILL